MLHRRYGSLISTRSSNQSNDVDSLKGFNNNNTAADYDDDNHADNDLDSDSDAMPSYISETGLKLMAFVLCLVWKNKLSAFLRKQSSYSLFAFFINGVLLI